MPRYDGGGEWMLVWTKLKLTLLLHVYWLLSWNLASYYYPVLVDAHSSNTGVLSHTTSFVSVLKLVVDRTHTKEKPYQYDYSLVTTSRNSY